MKILAIDISTEGCSVALLKNKIVYSSFERSPKNHTKYILPLIQKILNQSDTILNQLDILAFSRGPGSFTGIRICIGIIQGLALGAKLPIIGVSTLLVLAEGVWRKTGATQVLVSIDARMNEVYWAEYTRDECGIWHGEHTEIILKYNEVEQHLKQLFGTWTMAGNGWNIYQKIQSSAKLILKNSNVLFPEAKDILPIALYLSKKGFAASVEHAKPVYLCKKDIIEK